MALPDRYENEDVVEIPADLYQSLLEASAHADGWAKIRDGYKVKIRALIGQAQAAMVDGIKVVTYRPSNKWAEARIVKDHPDLAEHFMRQETREVFDLEAFRIRHPEIAEAYRVRQFRYDDND